MAKRSAKHSDATKTSILAMKLKMGQIGVKDLVGIAEDMIRTERSRTRLGSNASSKLFDIP